MEDEIKKIKEEITTLTRRLDNLNAFATIPYDTEKAFKDRLKLSEYSRLAASTKTAASETQSVNEGGAATYSVAKPMDGFRQVLIGSSTIYIPYYT